MTTPQYMEWNREQAEKAMQNSELLELIANQTEGGLLCGVPSSVGMATFEDVVLKTDAKISIPGITHSQEIIPTSTDITSMFQRHGREEFEKIDGRFFFNDVWYQTGGLAKVSLANGSTVEAKGLQGEFSFSQASPGKLVYSETDGARTIPVSSYSATLSDVKIFYRRDIAEQEKAKQKELEEKVRSLENKSKSLPNRWEKMIATAGTGCALLAGAITASYVDVLMAEKAIHAGYTALSLMPVVALAVYAVNALKPYSRKQQELLDRAQKNKTEIEGRYADLYAPIVIGRLAQKPTFGGRK